ncbi:hypothetical protein BC835DRAFT_1410332 [Cytidiella melzeri]|nr:hypothetical protein BC835DRAFT_1410332 [Cytidiella melzeri]
MWATPVKLGGHTPPPLILFRHPDLTSTTLQNDMCNMNTGTSGTEPSGSRLTPNSNISHPSLAVNIDALRQSLHRSEQTETSVEEEAQSWLEGSGFCLIFLQVTPCVYGLSRAYAYRFFVDTTCCNKICKRRREDLTKKWCERCRARQQRKIARQRSKAKEKREAERQAGTLQAAANSSTAGQQMVESEVIGDGGDFLEVEAGDDMAVDGDGMGDGEEGSDGVEP